MHNNYSFELVLLESETVDNFIYHLHRPEPGGYGAMPPDNMNTAWGVKENNTGIILTQGYVPWKKQGKEGWHIRTFDVKCDEGYFSAYLDTNAYGDYSDNCVEINNSSFYKYLNAVRRAIYYYMHGCYKNDDFKKFEKNFEALNGISIYSYWIKNDREVYDKWQKKMEALT